MHMETPHLNLTSSPIHHYFLHELAQHPMCSRVLCGAVAGVVAKTAIAPAEKVKMSYQVSMSKFSLSSALVTGRDMFFKEGFISLWRGHSTTIIRVAPFAGLNFMFHDYMEIALKRKIQKDKLPFMLKFLAGSFGGAMATICTYPLDVLRVRLALVQNSTWLGTIKQGGLYQGLMPTLLGIIPYSGTVWCVKQSLHDYYPIVSGHRLTSIEGLILNGIAGICGQFVSYPLDVLRRRMQMIIPSETNFRPTLGQMAWNLLETEGVKGLFKGFTLNLIKGPLSLSISLSTYDALRSWILCGEEEYNRNRNSFMVTCESRETERESVTVTERERVTVLESESETEDKS